MNKIEAAKIVAKIEIVQDWFDDRVDGEFKISTGTAYKLIEMLDEVK